MQCPVCQHDMTHSKAGWLCGNCGHTEAITGQSPAMDPITPATPVTPAVPVPPTEPIVPTPEPAPTVSTPLQPVTHPKKRSKLLLIGLPVLILILAAIGFYGWWWQPHMALTSYLNRLASAKTAVFSGSTTVNETDPTTSLTIKMSGHYDITSQTNPKADITMSGQVKSGDASSFIGSGSVGGEALFTDQTAYLKITDLSVLSSLIHFTVKPDWYKYALPASQQTNNCVSDKKDSGTVFGTSIVTNVPLTKVQRVGVFQTVDGHRTSHYSGTVDMTKLPAAIAKANRNLSAACQINVDPNSYKTLHLSYDLWDSSSFDRMVLAISDSSSKTNATVTLDTASYNKPVTIVAPSGAKDISQLYNDIITSITGAETNPAITTQ